MPRTDRILDAGALAGRILGHEDAHVLLTGEMLHRDTTIVIVHPITKAVRDIERNEDDPSRAPDCGRQRVDSITFLPSFSGQLFIRSHAPVEHQITKQDESVSRGGAESAEINFNQFSATSAPLRCAFIIEAAPPR